MKYFSRKKVKQLAMLMMLAGAFVGAQGQQQTPSGYVQPVALAGISPSGFAFMSVDSGGGLVVTPNTGTFSQIQGYVNPIAPVAQDPSGNWQYIQVDSNGAVKTTSSSSASGINGVYVDGGTYPDLCSALDYVKLNPLYSSYLMRAKIYDFRKYEVWGTGLDPFQAPTCGNGTASSFASIYFGDGVFVNATGNTIHVPTGSEVYWGGRAAESALSHANGCQSTTTFTQCIGTLLIAYNTVPPFDAGTSGGDNVMTCPGSCTVLASSVPVIDYGTSGAFGTVLQGPGTISAAGISGSIVVKNGFAQEESYLRDMTLVGAQSEAVLISGTTAQNFTMTGVEILSGNLTGNTIGTPHAFNGVHVDVNAPNRAFLNFTVNPRGTATTTSINSCLRITNSRGGRYGDFHCENADYWVVADGVNNGVFENINSAAASQDSSTPVAAIKFCAAGSSVPCTSGAASANNSVAGLMRISGNLTTYAIVDDTNGDCSGTIPFTSWNGTYKQPSTLSGAFFDPVVVYNTGSGVQTSGVTPTVMCTVGAQAITYQFGGFLDLSAPGNGCGGSETIALNVVFQDPSGAADTTFAAGTLNVTGNGTSGTNLPIPTVTVRAKGSTSVRYSTSLTGTCTTSFPSYRAFPILTKVSAN